MSVTPQPQTKPQTKAQLQAQLQADWQAKIAGPLALHQKGDFAGAVEAYRPLLNEFPDNPNLLNFLATALAQQNLFDEAKPYMEKAHQLLPDNIGVIGNYGHLLVKLGAAQKARDILEPAYEKVKDGGIAINLGLALTELKDYPAAADHYRQMVAADSDKPNLKNIARLLRTLAKLDDKTEGLALIKRHIPYQNMVHEDEMIDLAGAIADYFKDDHKQIIRYLTKQANFTPFYYGLNNQLGVAYMAIEQYQQSVSWLERARAMRPTAGQEAILNLSGALTHLGDHDRAIALLEDWLTHKPDDIDALIALCNHYRDQERFDDAARILQKRIDLNPENAKLYAQMGRLYKTQGIFEPALDYLQKAVALDPDDVEIRLSLSLMQLMLGDFEDGWENFNIRWQIERQAVSEFSDLRENFPEKLLTATTKLKDSHVIACPEQGYGDFIQFFRYAVELAGRAGQVSVPLAVSHFPLIPLLETSVPDNLKLEPNGKVIQNWHYHSSFMELAALYGNKGVKGWDQLAMPAPVRFTIPEKQLAAAKADLAGYDQPFKIGLVVAGNPEHTNDKKRSIGLNPQLMDIICAHSDKLFCLLHKQVSKADQDILEGTNCPKNLIWPSKDSPDFAYTAGLIDQMDLVVSVDTSIAHLTGSLGKKLWLLLPLVPDWRWGPKGEATIWYDSATIMRQPKLHDWQSVLTRVDKGLKALGK